VPIEDSFTGSIERHVFYKVKLEEKKNDFEDALRTKSSKKNLNSQTIMVETRSETRGLIPNTIS